MKEKLIVTFFEDVAWTEDKMLDDMLECSIVCPTGDGRTSITCKLGLWGVSAASESEALREAMHYWQQYLRDGEYDSLLNPDRP